MAEARCGNTSLIPRPYFGSWKSRVWTKEGPQRKGSPKGTGCILGGKLQNSRLGADHKVDHREAGVKESSGQ